MIADFCLAGETGLQNSAEIVQNPCIFSSAGRYSRLPSSPRAEARILSDPVNLCHGSRYSAWFWVIRETEPISNTPRSKPSATHEVIRDKTYTFDKHCSLFARLLLSRGFAPTETCHAFTQQKQDFDSPRVRRPKGEGSRCK
jgi:hypothetical protein